MERESLGFDWTRMRAFAATAEHGSLSAAARVLGLTQPTLGRQVAALEDELGVTLFERVGRSLRITEAGARLLPHARAMAEAAARIALIASGQAQSIEGRIRITASDVFSAYLMPDILTRLRDLAPRLTVDLVATNDLADLLRREADIAIRHVRPEQPDLIARRLVDATAHLYAARTYLERRGRPERINDLRQHEFVSFGDLDRMITGLADWGVSLTRDSFPTGSENGLVAWQLVCSGFGIAPMSEHVGRASPDVIRVLPDMAPIRFPVWLVTHRELHTSRRIRLVFDLIAEMLEEPRR